MTDHDRLNHLYDVVDDMLHELHLIHGGLQKVTFELLRKKLADGIIELPDVQLGEED